MANKIQRGTSSNLLQDDKLKIETQFALPVGDDFTEDEVASVKLGNDNRLKFKNSDDEVIEIPTSDDVALKATVTQIRALTGTLKSTQFYTTDSGQEGNWQYDPTDTTSTDNTGLVLVTSDGKRIKRVVEGSVDIKWFGAVSDGDIDLFTGTDNKNYLLAAFSLCSIAGLPLKISGVFATTPVAFTNIDGLTVNFEPGSYIIGFNGAGVNDRLITFGLGFNNVTINAFGSYIKTPVYGSGEQRHNVNITQASNLTINGLKCLDGGGDGFYIGSGFLPMPYNITLNRVATDNARRNGISIVSGININIIEPICENATGTLPMAGIDVEPNDLIDEVLQGIRIINPTTRGNGDGIDGCGILFSLASYVKNKEKTVDITVENHVSDGDTRGVMFSGSGSAVPWVNKLNGEVNYSGVVLNSKSMGAYIVSWDKDKAPMINAKLYSENAGETDSNNRGKAGLSVYAGGGSTFGLGNFNFDITVRDTRTVKKLYSAVYLENTTAEISGYNLNIDYDNTGSFGYPIFSSNNTKNVGTLKYSKKPTVVSAGSISAANVVRTIGASTEISASGTASLPLASNVIGQSFTFKNTGGVVLVTPNSPDEFFLFDRSQSSSIRLTKVGEYITIIAVVGGWLAIDYYISFSGTTADRPTATNIGYPYFDITIGKEFWWNGTTWISASDITETVTGSKTFSRASSFATVTVRSTAGLSTESAALRFQLRSAIGWDGIFQGLKLATGDNTKPIIFANSEVIGEGEFARFTGDGRFVMGATTTSARFEVVQPALGIGTVSTTAASGAVVGVGTIFTNTFRVGQTITVNGETRTISAITNNTNLTTDAWTGTNTSTPYLVVSRTLFKVKGNGRATLITEDYADNAAAIAGGLAVGETYRTGDLLKIVH